MLLVFSFLSILSATICPRGFHFVQYFSFFRRPNEFRKVAALLCELPVLCRWLFHVGTISRPAVAFQK
jgi:hypothetical protein